MTTLYYDIFWSKVAETAHPRLKSSRSLALPARGGRQTRRCCGGGFSCVQRLKAFASVGLLLGHAVRPTHHRRTATSRSQSSRIPNPATDFGSSKPHSAGPFAKCHRP